jgi:hypothetical protein
MLGCWRPVEINHYLPVALSGHPVCGIAGILKVLVLEQRGRSHSDQHQKAAVDTNHPSGESSA